MCGVPQGPLTWEADLLGPKETSLTVRDNLPDPLDQHTGHRLCAKSPKGTSQNLVWWRLLDTSASPRL